MAQVLTSAETFLPGAVGTQGRPVLAIVAILVFFSSSLVLAAGAHSPEKVVRWHSRLSRFHAELLAGPDWEVPMRALTSDEYVDYLRDGAEDPERFPLYVATFRRSFSVAAVVAFALFVVSLVVGPVSL